MGAGTSTLGGPSDVGKLVLSPQQQQQLDVVSNLFQLLLENNNIMNLAELVSMAEGQEMCNDLIITLSAQLDKDFQRIRLTASRGEVTEVGFLSKKGYEAIQKSDVRIDMCKKIARFLVQFVILVAALTASISIMDGLPDIQPVEQLYVPGNMTEAETLATGREELNPRLLKEMVDLRLLKEQSAPGFPTQEIYEFFGYLIHYRGFLYKYGSDKLFQIKIDYVRSNTCAAVGPGMPSAPGTPTLPGESRGYGSYMTPQEEVDERIRIAERKARAEAAEAAEKERLAAQRAQKEKEEALKQTDIERLKLQSYQLITSNKSDIDEIKKLFNDIEDILSKSPFLEVYNQYKINPQIKPSPDKMTIYTIINEYYPKIKQYKSIDEKYATLDSEIKNPYLSKETLTSKYNDLNRVLVDLRSVKSGFSSALEQLNKLPQTTSGGATDYFVITITPIEERVASSGMPSNFNTTRRNTGMGVPTGPSNSSFPTSYGSPTKSQLGGATPIQFVMDYAGNTYDLDYYCRMGGRVSRDQRSKPIRMRLEETFKTVPTLDTTLINKATNGTATSALSAFTGFKLDESSIKNLKQFGQMFNKMRAKEIQSPAAQRAYMLASKVENNRLYVKACKDPWGDKSFREIPAYALLGALYSNLLEQKDDGPTKDAGNLLKSAYLSSNESLGDTLWGNKTFDYSSQLYGQEALKPLCDERGFPMSNSAAVNIIKRAYGELKSLYSQQLEYVFKFMQQIFSVDRPFITALSAASGFQTTESILRLNPTFLQNNAEIQLLNLMQKARKDLDAHYAKVEQVYTKALTDLQNIPKPVGGARVRTRKAQHKANKRYNSLRKKRVARR